MQQHRVLWHVMLSSNLNMHIKASRNFIWRDDVHGYTACVVCTYCSWHLREQKQPSLISAIFGFPPFARGSSVALIIFIGRRTAPSPHAPSVSWEDPGRRVVNPCRSTAAGPWQAPDPGGPSAPHALRTCISEEPNPKSPLKAGDGTQQKIQKQSSCLFFSKVHVLRGPAEMFLKLAYRAYSNIHKQ